MSYLALCQAVQRLSRADINALGAAPTTVVGQVGVLGEIVDFVNRAYRDIQEEEMEWTFRVKQGTLALSSTVRSYSKATIQGSLTTYERILPIHGLYDRPHIVCYTTATGVSDSAPVWYVPYQEWRGDYDFGTRSSGKPAYFTILPTEALEFDPTPDAAYTIAFDYTRTIHELTTDSDATTGTPIFSTEFQNAIIWKAIEYFALTRSNMAELYAKAQREVAREMGKLRRECLPGFELDDSALL